MTDPSNTPSDTATAAAEAAAENARTESAGAEGSSPGRIADLEERLRIAEKQVALIRQAHAEATAEFDRVKDRMRRHQEQELERARLNMARNLFDVADNFDRTIDAARQGSERESLLRGVLMVRDSFQKALTGFGLVSYAETGDRFDPELHEAIGMVPVAAQALDGAVTLVFEMGYRAGDQVLRPARVQVGKYLAPPVTENTRGPEAPAAD